MLGGGGEGGRVRGVGVEGGRGCARWAWRMCAGTMRRALLSLQCRLIAAHCPHRTTHHTLVPSTPSPTQPHPHPIIRHRLVIAAPVCPDFVNPNMLSVCALVHRSVVGAGSVAGGRSQSSAASYTHQGMVPLPAMSY